jgi:hypothetical protein
MSNTVTCATCGKEHPREEIELVFALPQPIFELDEDQRAKRCDIDADMCAIDRSRFFLRGLLPIPVQGREVPYRIGLWAELDEPTFGHIYQLWDDPTQVDEPLLPAVLANDVPLVPSTMGVEIDIRLTGPTTRPDFFLRSTLHPLAIEQHRGVDAHRALEYSDRESRLSASHPDSD